MHEKKIFYSNLIHSSAKEKYFYRHRRKNRNAYFNENEAHLNFMV